MQSLVLTCTALEVRFEFQTSLIRERGEMERQTKNSFGFSWADEVEREEREEEQKAGRGVCAPEKPNPFGAARPREVVLAEKGVDWRKIDLELEHKSNFRKEKANKKISAVTSSSSRKQEQSSSPQLRCPDQKKSDTRKARSSCLGHQRQNPTLLIPTKFPVLIPQTRALDGGFPYPCEMVHHANGLMMQHRPMHVGCATTMLTGPSYNMEAMYDRRETEFRFKRKMYGDGLIGGPGQDMQMRNYVQERQFIDETAEMQAHGKRRILGDHNMERSILGKRPDDCEEYYGYEEAMYDRREIEFRFKRKLYGDGLIGCPRQDMQMSNYVQERRFIDETAEMLQAHGKRRILGDHNMERSILGKCPDDCEEYYGYELRRQNIDQVMMSQHCYESNLGACSMAEAKNGDRTRRDDLVVATSKTNKSRRGRKGKGTKK